VEEIATPCYPPITPMRRITMVYFMVLLYCYKFTFFAIPISRASVKYFIILTWQDHVIANVDQCDRLIGREVGGWPEFDFHRIFQRAGDATASPICSWSTVPGKHGSEDVVRSRATYHVRDERVSGN